MQNKSPEILLGMVAVMDGTMPRAELMFNLYKTLDHGTNLVENIEEKDNTIMFEIKGEMGFISLMPAPLPWGDLEGPCLTAWHWQEAEVVMKAHKYHYLVSLMPKNDQVSVLNRALTITKIIASVLDATDSVGVLWAPGTMVNSKMQFINSAIEASHDNFPINLWVEFRIESNPDNTINIITTGMAPLGHKEIEILNSRKEITELLGFVYNICNYLLENGPVINHEDTLGMDENQRIIAYYKDSIWERQNPVIQIQY